MQSKIIFELLLQPDLHYETNLKAYESRFAAFEEDFWVKPNSGVRKILKNGE
jgi:hypothetical protein